MKKTFLVICLLLLSLFLLVSCGDTTLTEDQTESTESTETVIESGDSWSNLNGMIEEVKNGVSESAMPLVIKILVIIILIPIFIIVALLTLIVTIIFDILYAIVIIITFIIVLVCGIFAA